MTHRNLDEILRLLSDQHRRQTIRFLRETPDGEARLEELSGAIIQETMPDGEQSDRIVKILHHRHLPKLREQGLIDYDPTARLVRYHPDQQVEAVMDAVSVKESRPVSGA